MTAPRRMPHVTAWLVTAWLPAGCVAIAEDASSVAPGEDAAETSEVLTRAERPSCVEVKHTSGIITQTVRVINRCSHRVSFVVKKVGLDSPCLHVEPGRIRSVKWANGVNYEGIRWGCD